MKKHLRRNLLLIVFACLITLIGCLQSVYAEGSSDLTENGGYRPYTERYGAVTAGIEREQRIYVYAEAGETVYFGSSVYNASTGYDIRVTGVTEASFRTESEVAIPNDGSFKEKYDVEKNGNGYIGSHDAEQAGPNVNGTTSGYNPLSFVAPADGVYIFRLYSTSLNTLNPTAATVDKLGKSGTVDSQQKGGTVAAWDVSVSNGGTIKPGRTWTYLLCLNIGANIDKDSVKTLNSQVYVLTDDGYTYRTDFNGMDPYGFLFFADSRGLIDTNKDASIYKSVKDPKNDNGLNNLKDVNVKFHNPLSADTEVDKTHKIFFNEPAGDLPTSIKAEIKAPEIEEVHFVPTVSGEADDGIVGSGGYFYIKGKNLTTFSLDLDFSVRKRDGATADTTLTEKSFAVSFRNNTSAGDPYNGTSWTKVYWDGADGSGTVVPWGTYGSAEKPFISTQLKSGEFHFPMIDVENNPFGIKIKNMNATDNSDTIYYNNSGVDSLRGLANADTSKTGISTAADSSGTSGGCVFNGRKGDMTAIDIWTYVTHPSTEKSKVDSFSLVDGGIINVKKIWKDGNDNDGVRPDSVEVALYRSTGGAPAQQIDTKELNAGNKWTYSWSEPVSDGNGADEKLYTYTVEETKIGNDSVAASTDYIASTEKDTLKSDDGKVDVTTNVTITNTHVLDTVSASVKKVWDDSNDADKIRPEQIETSLMDGMSPVTDPDTGENVTVTLSKDNNWTAQVDGLPEYQDGKKHDYNFVEQEEIDGYETAYATDGGVTTITNTHEAKAVPPEENEPGGSGGTGDNPGGNTGGTTGGGNGNSDNPNHGGWISTGDTNSIVIPCVVLAAAVMIALAMIIMKKKNNKR